MQLYNIFCSCLKPSTKKTENLRTRRKTSKQQHHQKRGECNSLTTALQQTIAARETCSGQNWPPERPAADNCRQKDLQRPIAARETCSGQLPPERPAAAKLATIFVQRPRPAPHVPQNLLRPPPCPPGSDPRPPDPSQSADLLPSSLPSSHSLLSPRSPQPNQSTPCQSPF